MQDRAKSLRATIRRIIDEADPEALLRIGAPCDEYDQEVSLIAARVNSLSIPSVEAVETIVYDVWQQQFGPFGERQEAYKTTLRPIAAAIYAEVFGG